MSKKIYEITLDKFVLNGEACQNIDVKWDKPECISVVCDDDEKGIYKITIPEGCEETCLYGVVYCLDESCGDCPDFKRIVICPCETDADCGECEECIGGVCVNICPEDTFCEKDKCVECDSEHPCDCNQICVGGKCQCPPDKPYMDNKGCCHVCKDDDDCPNCTVCTPDGCEPIDCGDGVCDPVTGECVECNNSGDCHGINECCMPDHTCDCCPGYKRDLSTGICVVDDGCVTDADCEVCEICVGDICVPLECPDGYTCIDGECVEICDCNEVYCSSTEACVDPSTGICYCNECEGDCDEDNECGVGCICQNFHCVPSPCKGTCVNGTDCGEGCGCYDGFCVPCSSHSCDVGGDCERVLGCECTQFGCVDAGGCTGYCTTYYDCGEGCTCWEGFCVPCQDFNCLTNECANQPGCKCDGNAVCIDDGTGGGDDCKDTLTLDKIDETCDLKGELKTVEDCSCSKMTLDTVIKKVKAGNSYYLLDLDVELRKGVAESLQQAFLLSKVGDTTKSDIADNEAPNGGTIRVLIQPFYNTYDSNGKLTGVNEPGIIVESNKTFANTSVTDTLSFKDLQIPFIGSDYGSNGKVSKVKVTVVQNTTLTFPNNCEYNKPTKDIDSFTITKNNEDNFEKAGTDKIIALDFEGYLVISSDSKRYALFTWYKSEDGSYDESEIIRSLYIPSNNKDYVDTLFGPKNFPVGKYPLEGSEGNLRSGKYYMLKADCTCAEPVDLGKVVFCNPTELNFDVLECSTKIKINKPFKPCDVNQDLAKFGINDPDSQVKYDLYLNDTLVRTFVHNKEVGMIQTGSWVDPGSDKSMFATYSLDGEVIKNVKLKINHDTEEKCTLNYDLPEVEERKINYTVNCDLGTGDEYEVRISKIQDVNITDIKAVKGTVNIQLIGNDYVLRIKKGVFTQVEIIFEDNCSQILSFFEDCCDNLVVDLKGDNDGCNEDVTLIADIIGGTPSFNVVFEAPSGKTYQSEVGYKLTLDHTTYENGTWKVRVTDSVGCVAEDSISLSNVGYTFNYPPELSYCEGEDQEVYLTGTQGAKVYIQGSSVPVTLPGYYLLQDGQNEIVYTKIEVGGCTYTLNEKTVVNWYDKPVADFDSALNQETVCSEESPKVYVTGTPNVTVVFSIDADSGANITSDSTLVLDNNGKGVISVPDDKGVYTIRITKVISDNCSNDTVKITHLQVIDNPQLVINNETYQCNENLSKYSVDFMSNYPLIQVTKGIVDHLGGDNYKLKDVPKGESSTITVHNGSCTTIKNTASYQCSCNEVEVTKPVSNGDGEYCEGNESIPELSVVLADPTYIAQWFDKYGNIVHTGTNFTPTPEQLYGSATKFYVKAIDVNGCESDETVVMMYENYPPQSVEIKDYSTSHCENTVLNLDSIVTAGNSTGPFTFEWSVDAGSIVGSNTNSYVSILLPSEGTTVTVTLKVTSSEGCYTYQQYIIDDIEGDILATLVSLENRGCVNNYGYAGTWFNGSVPETIVGNEAWGVSGLCVDSPATVANNRLNLVGKKPMSTAGGVYTGIYEVPSIGDVPLSIGFSLDNIGKLELSVNGGNYYTVFDFSTIPSGETDTYYLKKWWVDGLEVSNGDILCFRVTVENVDGPVTFGMELYKESINVLKTYTTKSQVDAVQLVDTSIFTGYEQCADGSDPVIENCVGYCNCTN